MNIADLVNRKANAWGRMREIRELAGAENRDMTAAEVAEWEREERNLEAASRDLEAYNRPTLSRVLDPNPAGTRAANEYSARAIPIGRDVTLRSHLRTRGIFPQEHDDLSFGAALRGMITGDWSGASEEARALSHVGADGGYAVPYGVFADIVDRMRQKARVLEAGAELVEMTAGTVPIPKLTGGATASWHLDNAAISDSDPTFGVTELSAKTLAALVKIPIGLADDAPLLGRTVERELAAAMALELDRAALYGDGAAGEPVGIVNTAGVATESGGALASWDKFLTLEQERLDNGADRATAAILSNRTWKSLAALKTGITNDNTPLVRPAELEALRLLPTGQVSITEGAGSDSRVFVGGFEEVIVGVRMGLTIKILEERFIDNGQIGVIAFWRGDIAIPRPGALGMLTAVTN